MTEKLRSLPVIGETKRMTVKELKEKLAMLDETREVEIVVGDKLCRADFFGNHAETEAVVLWALEK